MEKSETPQNPRLTLRKAERLCSHTLVERLFAEGQSTSEYPLRVVWHVYTPEQLRGAFRAGEPRGIAPLQMMVTIPKKKQRHAVDRVWLRRRVREAYRLNRLPLLERVSDDGDTRLVSMAFIYLSNDRYPYERIERSMVRLLDKIAKQLYGKSEEEERESEQKRLSEEDTP